MSLVRIAVVSSLIVSGCVGDAEEELGTTAQEAKAQPGVDSDECPPWACGSNSPIIDFAGFHELYKKNVPNLEGFMITAFRKQVGVNWVPYNAEVINGGLVAKNDAGTIIYSGSGVVGMVFTITRGASTYYMKVVDVSRAPLWAKVGGVTRVTPTYKLTWSTTLVSGTLGTPVCGVSTEPDGIDDYYAVLFENDRIDADAIKVTGETPGWFNVGCAGHLLAKSHLMGYTHAAAAIMGVPTPSLNARSAVDKAISADYCKGGNPMTVAGVPLHFKDSTNRMNNLGSNTHLEARWNENGAICLNTPRVDWTWTVAGFQQFPGGVEPLLVGPPMGKWCTGAAGTKLRPPPCTNVDLNYFQGGYILTVEE